MKRLFTFLVLITLTICFYGQPPQKMSYQAVIRNTTGGLITNHAVGMRISILQGSATGTPVYVENHTVTTNANGLATIEVGGGTIVSGTFSAINWSSGIYHLKTETDPAGGSSYTIIGTSQILSVPYAQYSKTAQTADYNSLSNLPTLNITNWNNAFGWGNHAGLYKLSSYVPAWSEVTGKPTSISGYGITDAVTITSTQSISGNKTFNNDIMVNGLTVGRGKGNQSENTAFGMSALYSITTGIQNSAFGYGALLLHKRGYGNTAIGFGTLSSDTIGNFNTATGAFALNHNISGLANTSIGSYTLVQNKNGNYNTAVGNEAGNNSIGNGNVFLGYRAGYYETGSNKLFIDNQLRADESDARKKSLIYGEFSADPLYQSLTINGKVGIGQYPGGDARNFQSVTGSNVAIAGVNNTSDLFLPAVFAQNLGSGLAFMSSGKIKIVDGTQGNGKVLTSDATGLASWAAPVLVLPYTATALSDMPVFSITNNGYGNGIWAVSNSPTGTTGGVIGDSYSSSGSGVIGNAYATSGTTYGIKGKVISATGYAGYFEGGRLYVQGNVGIGFNSPSEKLEVNGNIQFTAGTDRFLILPDRTKSIFIGGKPGNQSSYAIFFITDNGSNIGVERLAIKSDKVGIGTVSPSQTLDVNGSARFRSVGSGAYSYNLNLTSDGTLTTASSDVKLKENIRTLDHSLRKVMELRGVSFTWKNNPGSGTHIGFVAQEFEKVMPELVFTNETDGYKGINYSEVSAVLVEALKEQQKQIMEQQQQIDELKQLVKNLMQKQ